MNEIGRPDDGKLVRVLAAHAWMDDALDRLESQLGGVWRKDLAVVREELQRLREERDEYLRSANGYAADSDYYADKAKAAEARCARLRVLLKEARSLIRASNNRVAHWHDLVDEWDRLARAALAAEETEKDSSR